MAVILPRGHKTQINQPINPKTLHDKFSSNLVYFFFLNTRPYTKQYILSKFCQYRGVIVRSSYIDNPKKILLKMNLPRSKRNRTAIKNPPPPQISRLRLNKEETKDISRD